MSEIQITEVTTRRDLDRFIKFNHELYKNHPYAVPDLYFDLRNTLSERNAARDFCDCALFLAWKGGKVAGRVAAIINRKANEAWDTQVVRFGWIDFVDDIEVSSRLLRTVEEWGRQRGMTEIQGPLGFTDMDPEGMLVEGFDEIGTMATIYNYPYYPQHLETLGFEKEADWIEMRMRVPREDGMPPRLTRIAELVKEKYGLQLKKFKTTKEMARAYGQEIFDVINRAFSPLFGYSALTPRQIDQYVKMYFSVIDPQLVSLIADSEGKLIGVGISMPSLAEALQKSKGRLFPFGWWHLLKALKWRKPKTLELMLVAVLPEWQSRGVNALFFYDLLPLFVAGGYEWVESNVELETNLRVQQQWIYFERRQHKRRRCFKRTIVE